MNALSDRIKVVKGIVAEDLKSHPEMRDACLAILKFLAEERQDVSHITFFRFKEIIGKSDNSTLISAVYFLADQKIDVLQQHFEALHPVLERYEEVPLDDVVHALSEKDFANPFTGEQLTELEFKSLIIPFFSPSKHLMGGK